MTLLEFIVLGLLCIQLIRKCPKEIEDMMDIWDIRDIRLEIIRRRNR